jgi:hypothetical protein
MKKIDLKVGLLLGLLAGLGSVAANAKGVPPRNVVLRCAPLSYVIDCSVSRNSNPELDTNCWYVAEGKSWVMDRHRHFNFSNEIVSIHLNNNMQITANLTERATGNQTVCSE